MYGSADHRLGLPMAGVDILVRDGPKEQEQLDRLTTTLADNMRH
jgi:hypothetical protein